MLLAVLVVGVAVGAIVSVVAIAAWQRQSLQKSVRIQVDNEGNTWARYELGAQDPDGALEFTFSLAGLRPTTTKGVQAPSANRPAQATEGSEAAEKNGRRWSTPAGPAAETEKAREKAKETYAQTKKALGLGGALAEMLTSLGMILPRSLGRPLLDISNNIRRTQGRVETVERMPVRVSGQVSKMQKAAPAVEIPQAKVPQGEIALPETSLPKATKSAAEAPAPAREAPPSPVLQRVGEGWVRTPPVEPGGKFQCDLLIRPRKLRKTRLYSFDLLSRIVGLEDEPPVRREWTVRITGARGWRRYHPYLFIFGLTILALLLAYGLARLGVLS